MLSKGISKFFFFVIFVFFFLFFLLFFFFFFLLFLLKDATFFLMQDLQFLKKSLQEKQFPKISSCVLLLFYIFIFIFYFLFFIFYFLFFIFYFLFFIFIFYLKNNTDAHTIVKANNVPIETMSLNVSISKKRAKTDAIPP